MADIKTEHKCPACEHGVEKKKTEWLTGPDQLHGGDGLPDWMQFAITTAMFATLLWVLNLLFHPNLELAEKHRDLLNIILGSFIASFGKVIDFWFRGSKKKTDN